MHLRILPQLSRQESQNACGMKAYTRRELRVHLQGNQEIEVQDRAAQAGLTWKAGETGKQTETRTQWSARGH